MANRKKTEEEQKKRSIHVRFNEVELNEIKIRAAANHYSISDFVRRTVFDERFRYIHTDFETYREFKALHNDLNRLGNYMISNAAKETLGEQNAFVVREKVFETLKNLDLLIDLCNKAIRTIKQKNTMLA